MKNKSLNIFLKSVCQKHNLPGISVCFRDGNNIEFKGVYGNRSNTSNDHLDIDDLFRAGSTTKTLIATIIMQLKEEGFLSLNDPVSSILRDETNIEPSITISQLLNHRSGLEDYLWVLEESGQPIIRKFDGALKHYPPKYLVNEGIQAKKRYIKPGEGFYYSNTNYILLGLIIEKITNQLLAEVVKQRIIKELRLEQTYLPNSFSIHQPHANGHSKYNNNLQRPEEIVREYDDLNVSLAWAAGALISTPGDLNKFMYGLINKQLISKESLEEMMAFIETGDRGQSYGLGLYEFKEHQKIAVGHPGGISGYETIMLYYPNDSIYLTVMINQMPAGSIKIADEIYNFIKDKNY